MLLVPVVARLSEVLALDAVLCPSEALGEHAVMAPIAASALVAAAPVKKPRRERFPDIRSPFLDGIVLSDAPCASVLSSCEKNVLQTPAEKFHFRPKNQNSTKGAIWLYLVFCENLIG